MISSLENLPDWSIIPLFILSVLFSFYLAGAWFAAGLIVRRRKPDPPSTPGDHRLPYENVIFTSRDGVELAGWLTGPDVEVGRPRRRPIVIFCPGGNGSMDGDTGMLIPFFHAGFDVLQFDWRGHGRSDGNRTSLGIWEVADVVGAVDFAQSRGATKIVLLGFSMGGAVALRAAAWDKRVSCVIADGAYASVEHALEGFAKEKTGWRFPFFIWLAMRLAEGRLGELFSNARPGPSLGGLHLRPVLFIYGDQDPIVPVADQDALFEACSKPKELWRVEGAGHRDIHKRDPDGYYERVIGFIKTYLH
jgi:pimeloyl-ACP methyl ester carboxylesterase